MRKFNDEELGNIAGGMGSYEDGSYCFDLEELNILRNKEGYDVEMICDDDGNLTYRYIVLKESKDGTLREVGEEEIINVLNKYE